MRVLKCDRDFGFYDVFVGDLLCILLSYHIKVYLSNRSSNREEMSKFGEQKEMCNNLFRAQRSTHAAVKLYGERGEEICGFFLDTS